MNTRIDQYNDYVIITDESEERGIFFRNPLQKIFFDAYGIEGYQSSAWKYQNTIKNPIRKWYEILIGNGDIIKNISSWLDDGNFAGFDGRIICSPIYFKRNYRKLTAISCNADNNITTIESYGYESEFNYCSGDCYVERTVFRLKNGQSVKLERRGQYHYTYAHIIKDIIHSTPNKK